MASGIKDKISSNPPVILALETATACGSVAMVADSCCLAESSLLSKITHSRRLLFEIEQLFQATDFTWEKIDAIAVSAGPGSFTGLRIGMSTAKGLAMAAGKKLISIPTLDGLASQLSFTPYTVCPVLDAKKKEVYTAFFQCRGKSSPKRISDYMAVTPDKLGSLIQEQTVIIGDGVESCEEMIESLAHNALIPSPATIFPRAAAIGMLAAEKWKNNECMEISTAVPIYVRASDAEIHFTEKIK